MNFLMILAEIGLATFLYLGLTYLKTKDLKTLDLIIIPSIYLIIISALFPSLKNTALVILIFYLAIDVLALIFLNKKDLLMNEDSYYKNLVLTLITGFLVYHFFLLKVETAFLDMNVFKNFVWLLIILYLIKKLDLTSKKLKGKETRNFDQRFQEFVVVSYAKFKNKYSYLIKTKDIDIEYLIYSFLIYEDYLHGKLYRLGRNLKNKLQTTTGIYGIMGVKSDHFITSEESIVIMKEKLEEKLKRLSKSSKDDKLKKLINEKYKETKDYKEIVKIIKILKEFNQEEN